MRYYLKDFEIVGTDNTDREFISKNASDFL